MNWLDSARVSGALQGVGHEQVTREHDAEIIFVNSCTVTSEADRKSRQITNSACSTRPDKTIAVMGCGPKVDYMRWKEGLPAANVFQSEQELFSYFDITDEHNLYPLTNRTRLPIAIQQGCDNQCSFCITRIARGKHSNTPLERIIEHIRLAEDNGVKEIILTGINLAAWGCTDSNNAEETKLPELLETIIRHTEIPRIRLSSVGPQYLNDRFFDVFQDERICDHLHLSIQSGSATIVERMIRGHGIDEIHYIADTSRRMRADVALTCDLIVGFPGESERHFEETLELVEAVRFAKLHVFPFSVREGTPAEQLAEQIPMAERKVRAAHLRAIGRNLRHDFIRKQLGARRDILVEMNGLGHTGNYIQVKAPADAQVGKTVNIELTRDNVTEL